MRWIWLAVLGACGDNEVPRLEPVAYELAGVRWESPGHFHDRARGEDCTGVRWSDGATYCTPALAPVVYLDSACSEEVAMGSGAYAPTFFTIGGTTSVRRIYPVVPRAAPAQYFLLFDGFCQGPYPAAPDEVWGELTSDELDESAFVRMYRSAPEGRDRLQTIAINTLDGLHVPTALHDRDLGFDCVFSDTHDRDRVPCMPADAALPVLFADASCTEPVAEVTDETPAFAALGCDTLARVGAEITGTVYDGASGGCQPTAIPAGFHAFAIGDPVDLAYATRERRGTARIQPIDLVAGAARVPDGTLHDALLDADCAVTAGRCLPPAASIATYYTDEGCTQEVDIAIPQTTACGAPMRFAFRDAYHAIGDAVGNVLYVPSTGDRCMLQPPAGEPHAVGPALATETFVPAL